VALFFPKLPQREKCFKILNLKHINENDWVFFQWFSIGDFRVDDVLRFETHTHLKLFLPSLLELWPLPKPSYRKQWEETRRGNNIKSKRERDKSMFAPISFKFKFNQIKFTIFLINIYFKKLKLCSHLFYSFLTYKEVAS